MHAKNTAHLMLAGHSLVAAEALAFAAKAGLSVANVLEMLSGTINSSAVFEQRAPQVLVPAVERAAHGHSRTLREPLQDVRRLAADIGAATPVLEQALRHIHRLPESTADELTVAFYELLAGDGQAIGHPLPARQQP
jgi:3-hydroxyisobutyrate dehydrogenase-like beta-hydroxyacid dehydrogenase